MTITVTIMPSVAARIARSAPTEIILHDIPRRQRQEEEERAEEEEEEEEEEEKEKEEEEEEEAVVSIGSSIEA